MKLLSNLTTNVEYKTVNTGRSGIPYRGRIYVNDILIMIEPGDHITGKPFDAVFGNYYVSGITPLSSEIKYFGDAGHQHYMLDTIDRATKATVVQAEVWTCSVHQYELIGNGENVAIARKTRLLRERARAAVIAAIDRITI